MRTAILWSTEGDRVRCSVCPNRCLIADGSVGICGVRENQGGTLVPLTYGRVSSIAADPIEKKPVFHYFPGTSALSLGSVGCSMRCGHCQNWQISRAKAGDGSVGLNDLSPERVVEMARAYRCPGVAFTYNEPVIWIEYVLDVARLCHEAGLYTVMVTNGYITLEALEAIGTFVDVWRTDLKGATDQTYRRLCRVSSAESVRQAAQEAKYRWKMHVEVVTNVVPTINDSTAELQAMARWIADDLGHDTPWHVTRFFPYLEFADLPPTPMETLRAARTIGREAGLHYVYLGNIREPGGEDTVCPNCGKVVVRRVGYTIEEKHTSEGTCAFCGHGLNITE